MAVRDITRLIVPLYFMKIRTESGVDLFNWKTEAGAEMFQTDWRNIHLYVCRELTAQT